MVLDGFMQTVIGFRDSTMACLISISAQVCRRKEHHK